MAKKSRFWMTGALALVLLSATALSFGQLPDDIPLPSVAVEKSLQQRGNGKIDPRLWQLATSGESDTRDLAVAKGLGTVVDGQMVAVALLTSDSQSEDEARRSVEAAGGTVQTSTDGVVYAMMPVGQLNALSESDSLDYIAPQPEYSMLGQSAGSAAYTSEGIAISRATLLHQRGIRGRGVRVGIIDGGFRGYRELQTRGKLPAPTSTRAFNRSMSLDNGTVHGTGCAEIIHEMAPGAELFLASVDGTEGQIIQAAQWLIEQRVDVINFSMGSPQRGDGKDVLSRLVEKTTQEHGILWLVSAGNEADAHWAGNGANVHANGLLRTTPDGGNAVVIKARSSALWLFLRWDDWGTDPSRPAANEDLDLFVFTQTGNGKWEAVARSEIDQAGSQPPLESVTFPTEPGRTYLAAIRAKRPGRRFAVHLFADGRNRSGGRGEKPELSPLVPGGSIMAPAAASSAVAVGAVDVTQGQLSSYSSRGPTEDGRVKPEVAAPDNTSSLAYQGQGGRFRGTSAAAPHVTGFAALLKEVNPGLKGLDLRAALVRYVRQMSSPSPNNEYGYGHVDATQLAEGGTSPWPTSESPVQLPRPWGGTVSSNVLDQILSSSTMSDDVKVVVGNSRYRIGDGMKIGFRSSTDCSYLLFNRTSRGEYSLIAPLDGDPPRLQAGERYALPSGSETLKITGPPGREQVILVCSPSPVPLRSEGRGGYSISIAEYEVIQ